MGLLTSGLGLYWTGPGLYGAYIGHIGHMGIWPIWARAHTGWPRIPCYGSLNSPVLAHMGQGWPIWARAGPYSPFDPSNPSYPSLTPITLPTEGVGPQWGA